MKATVTRPVEIDIKFVRIAVPVNYGEEDMPKDFPFRDRENDIWDVTVDIDTGKIENWPAGVEHDLHMKVCDGGSYWLLDDKKSIVGCIDTDYVPHGVVPGEYGDYIVMQIKSDGTIANWPKWPNVSSFFPC